MSDDGQERVEACNRRLKELLLRYMDRPELRPSSVDGLVLVRREESNSM